LPKEAREMRFVWNGGPAIITNGVMYGIWGNHDLTPWTEDANDPGRWFGYSRWIDWYGNVPVQRTILYLGLVALYRSRRAPRREGKSG
jgi:hypothetical protein